VHWSQVTEVHTVSEVVEHTVEILGSHVVVIAETFTVTTALSLYWIVLVTLQSLVCTSSTTSLSSKVQSGTDTSRQFTLPTQTFSFVTGSVSHLVSQFSWILSTQFTTCLVPVNSTSGPGEQVVTWKSSVTKVSFLIWRISF